MNYFCQFCYELTLPSEDAVGYALDLAHQGNYEEPEIPWPDELREHLASWTFEVNEETLACAPNTICIFSEEGGLDAAMAFTKHLLAKYNMPDVIQFSWGCYGDRPATDAASGGGAIVTATSIETQNSHEWLAAAPWRKVVDKARDELSELIEDSESTEEAIRDRAIKLLLALNALDGTKGGGDTA